VRSRSGTIVIVNGFIVTAPAAGAGGSSLLLARVVGADHFDFNGQVFGTQIHHAGPLASSVIAVAIPMIEPPQGARLVRCPGSPNNLGASDGLALLAAVRLPVIAIATHVEDHPASHATNFSLAVCGHVRQKRTCETWPTIDGSGSVPIVGVRCRPEGSGVMTWAFSFGASVGREGYLPGGSAGQVLNRAPVRFLRIGLASHTQLVVRCCMGW